MTKVFVEQPRLHRVCLKIYTFIYLQGILGLLSAVLGTRFFLSCYTPVGEVMDLLALGNSAANFLLYCLMSTQFRATLAKMLGLEARLLSSGNRTVNPKPQVISRDFGNCFLIN